MPIRDIDEAVARALEELHGATVAELRQRWTAVYGRPPRLRSKSDFLRRALAYEAQAKLLGGLSATTRRRLRRLAEGKPNSASATRASARLKPGTRLLREWQGEPHHVTVLEEGFEYRGQRYASLSVIARHITGTRWSGPMFFGLRDGKRHDR